MVISEDPLTPIAESLALDLTLPVLLDLGLSQRRMNFLIVYSSEMLTTYAWYLVIHRSN